MDDRAVICVKCGVPVQNAVINHTQNIPNYLAFSIVVTILCCMPFGIPAIVYSSQVNTKLLQGDVNGAKDSSNKAKIWCIVSLCSGIGVALIYLVLVLIADVFH